MPGLAGNCPENTLKKPHKRKEITGDTGKAPRPVAFRTLRAEIMVTTMGVELDGKTRGGAVGHNGKTIPAPGEAHSVLDRARDLPLKKDFLKLTNSPLRSTYHVPPGHPVTTKRPVAL